MKTLFALFTAFIVTALASATADTTVKFSSLKKDKILALGKFGRQGVIIRAMKDGECLIVRRVGTSKCPIVSNLIDYSPGTGTVGIWIVTPQFQEPAVTSGVGKISIDVLDIDGGKYAVSGYDASGKKLFRVNGTKTASVQIPKAGVRSIILDSKNQNAYVKAIHIKTGAIKAL